MINLHKNDEPYGNSENSNEETIKQIYAFAANLLFEENKSKREVTNELMSRGLDAESSEIIVNNLTSAKKKAAEKDMFYGALWCIGGTIATVANIGFIFWGAIVFGAIQFLKGLYNYLK